MIIITVRFSVDPTLPTSLPQQTTGSQGSPTVYSRAYLNKPRRAYEMKSLAVEITQFRETDADNSSYVDKASSNI